MSSRLTLPVVASLFLAGCVSYEFIPIAYTLEPPALSEERPGYHSMAWLVRRGTDEYEAQVCSMAIVWKVHAVCSVTSRSALVAGSTLVPLEGRTAGTEPGEARAYLGAWNIDGTEVWRWIDDRDVVTEARDLSRCPDHRSAIVVVDGGGDLVVGRVSLVDGAWAWRRTFGLPNQQEYEGKAMALPDGGAIVACRRIETGLWVFRLGPSGEVVWEWDTPCLWPVVAGVTPGPSAETARVMWWSVRQYFAADVSATQWRPCDPHDEVDRSSTTFTLRGCPLTRNTVTVIDNRSPSTWITTVYWLTGGATRISNFSPLGTFEVAPDRVILVGDHVEPAPHIMVAELTPGRARAVWHLDFGFKTLEASAVWADKDTTWLAGGGAYQ